MALFEIVIGFALLQSALGGRITFNNARPRLDLHGNIVNGHDGPTVQFEENGPFYYYAMECALCKEPSRYGCDMTSDKCGFHLNHNISIWKSANLSSGSWQYVGNAIDVNERPAGTVYRPQILFNKKTQMYVLWWNYVTGIASPSTTNSSRQAMQSSYHGYAVGVSATPEGPFKLLNDVVNVTRLADGPGDYALFADDDGTAYVAYSAAHLISIEKLTDDYIYSTGENATYGTNPAPGGTFPVPFVEAPAMFKRDNLYYMLFGHCCCYCYQGSGIFVWTATSPLGPWTPQGPDIACHSNTSTILSFAQLLRASPTPGQGCLYNSSTQQSATRAQQNYVIQAPGSDGSTVYLWTGDRWQQSPDGLKVGDEGDPSRSSIYSWLACCCEKEQRLRYVLSFNNSTSLRAIHASTLSLQYVHLGRVCRVTILKRYYLSALMMLARSKTCTAKTHSQWI